MSLLSDIELLEEELEQLSKEFQYKRAKLKKLLNGIKSHTDNIYLHNDRKVSSNLRKCLSYIYDNMNTSSLIVVDKKHKYIYFKPNEVVNALNLECYSGRDLTNNLKSLNIITGSSKEYYKSVRVGNSIFKGVKIQIFSLHKLLKEA